MNYDDIINSLVKKNIISNTESLLLLANKSSPDAFATKLISLYEEKISDYVEISQLTLARHLRKSGHSHPEENALQQIILSTQHVFHALAPIKLMSVLIHLLKLSAPDLLLKLGLATLTDKNISIADHVKKIFIKIVARQRLFADLKQEQSQELCESIQTLVPALFPAYLYNSFMAEKQLGNAIQSIYRLNSHIPINDISLDVLSASINNDANFIQQALAGILYYQCESLAQESIEPALKNVEFKHLESPEAIGTFISHVIHGFIQQIQLVKTRQNILRAHQDNIDDPTNQHYYPALSILGVDVKLNMDDFKKIAAAAAEHLQKCEALKDVYANEAAAAKAKAQEAIQSWRHSIPELPITYSIEFEKIPFNLK